MNLDQAVRELERLRRENQSLREHFTFQPEQAVFQGDSWWVRLDAYEVANLRSALEAVNRADSPISAMNSGDWVCQILQKLPKVDHRPNVSTDDYVEAAKRWGR